MIGNNKIKETDIKNLIHHHFDGMIKINDFNPKYMKVFKKHIKIFSFTTLNMKHKME